MRANRHKGLLIEVVVAFAPACLLVAIFWVPGFFINLGNEHQSILEQLEPAALVMAAAAGVTAAYALLMFVEEGTRPVRQSLVLTFAVLGLLLSGWATAGFLGSDDLKIFSLIPAGPLFCGLHLLYLGRHYFGAANKPMEPKR
jgi:hypothetical protein